MGEVISSLDRETLVLELNRLIHLDFDAIAAYEAALEHLHDPQYQDNLRNFMADHQRHTEELAVYVRKYEGKPATSGDMKKVLTKGRVLMASLGSDRRILEAMHANEDQTNAEYERAVQKLADEPEVAAILRRNLNDERRHRQWLVSTLDGLA